MATGNSSTQALNNVGQSRDLLVGLSSESRSGYWEYASVGAANSNPPTRIISTEQAAAVCKYVNEFEGSGRQRHPHIKFLMLGQIGVGMYCLMVNFIHDAFFENYDPLREDDFALETYIGAKLVRFEGATERPTLQWSAKTWPQGFISPYRTARHCESCIFVYDVTSRESFESIQSYYSNFCIERSLERPQSSAYCYHDCPRRPEFQGLFFVIANKIDRDEAEWTVSSEEGEAFCASIGAIFMPMSAKTGQGSGSNAVLEMATHILFRRTLNKPLLREETTAKQDQLTSSAGHIRARLTRCWSTFARRRGHKNHQLESEITSDEQVSRAVDSQSLQLRDPNELYWY